MDDQMNMKTEKRGFTLIELLVVIAIIGVLFAVAMPMFESMGRKDTDRAAFQFMTTLRLARQHAVNKRQWTFVILPNMDGSYTTNTIDKCLRSYAVLAATNNLDGKYKFNENLRDPSIDDMELTFVSDWRYLSEGIYFDDDITLPANNMFPRPPPPATQFYEGIFLFPADPANPNQRLMPMSAIAFKPNGRAYVMADGSSTGSFWQDTDTRIYITSSKFYEKSGNSLVGPQSIQGTNSILNIQGKSGQVSILN